VLHFLHPADVKLDLDPRHAEWLLSALLAPGEVGTEVGEYVLARAILVAG